MAEEKKKTAKEATETNPLGDGKKVYLLRTADRNNQGCGVFSGRRRVSSKRRTGIQKLLAAAAFTVC